MIKIIFQYIKKTIVIVYIVFMAKFLDAASLNNGLLACCRLWRQKITTKWLKGTFSLDVVVVAFMNTEGPFVPFPTS